MFSKSGVLIVNKPSGLTTNDVIQKIKRKFNIKKIGHAGTLDPLATGVVVCLVNNGTKISDYLLSADKQYLVTMKLFIATDSYDSDGKIIQQDSKFEINLDQIKNVVQKYDGLNYNQTPPIYSAIKVDGKKLYEYARENKQIEVQKRNITIKKLEFISFENDEITLKVDCSKGTYIRSLIVDIAKDLGTIAHVTMLRRTKSGDFYINDSKTIENIEEDDLISMNDSLMMNNQTIIDYDNIQDILFGKKIKLNCKQDLVFIQDKDKNIIACYERQENDLFRCKRGGLNN